MKLPKTVKGLLKLLILIAEDGVEVWSTDTISEDERMVIGSLIANIQNDLGEMPELLEKFGLKYNG